MNNRRFIEVGDFSIFSFLPESPHWLYQRRHYDSAKKSLVLVAKINRKPIDLDKLTSFLELQQVTNSSVKKGTISTLFKSPSIAKPALVLAFCRYTYKGFKLKYVYLLKIVLALQ